LRIFNSQVNNELRKQTVSPCEPTPGKIGCVIFVETFMNEVCRSSSWDQLLKTIDDLLLIGGSEPSYNDTHRPHHIDSSMWSSHSLASLSFKIVLIIVLI